MENKELLNQKLDQFIDTYTRLVNVSEEFYKIKKKKRHTQLDILKMDIREDFYTKVRNLSPEIGIMTGFTANGSMHPYTMQQHALNLCKQIYDIEEFIFTDRRKNTWERISYNKKGEETKRSWDFFKFGIIS